MRVKKGKRKVLLYKLRNQKKIFRNKVCTNKKKRNREGRRAITGDNSFIGNVYNQVIGHLDQKKFGLPKWECRPHKSEEIQMPEVFSISENAELVISILRKLYTVARDSKTEKICFDHTRCINLGLSASTVMDIILLAVDKYRERLKKPLLLKGTLPRDEQAKDILLASGLPEHLKATILCEYDKKHVMKFDTIQGVHDQKANKADETATKLTNYFIKCLRTQHMELNNEGKRLLSRILGEVISNCEIHGGNLATWYTQGHYQIQKDNSFGEMQLLFLNIGDTIYEGLKNDSSAETKEKLSYMKAVHHKHLNKKWDEEMLYTVFALQEGISRLRDKGIEGFEGRGSGTVSMIEMFYDIGESDTGLKPQMTILSGKTLIKFLDNYKMKSVGFVNDKVFGSGKKKIIAFNDKNDIYFPADPQNVIKISQYFPGTIISLKFYLDSRYISSQKRKG